MDGENAVIASNLTRLRSARGLSQTELARKSGISRVALGKIERAECIPRADTLCSVGQRVGRACPRACYASFDSEIGSFPRAQAGAGPRGYFGGSCRLASRLCLAGKGTRRRKELQTSELKRHLGLAWCIGKRQKEREQMLGLKAQDPILDICELFENNGIRVRLLNRATDAFFGLSVGPEESGPAVVVNAWERISVERWIFTAAHELGHLLFAHQLVRSKRGARAIATGEGSRRVRRPLPYAPTVLRHRVGKDFRSLASRSRFEGEAHLPR